MTPGACPRVEALGGGIFNAGVLDIEGTVVWGNTSQTLGGPGSGLLTSAGHNLIAQTSGFLIQGTGRGDLYDVDPLFASPDGSPLSTSPCVDAGGTPPVLASADLDDLPRLLDGDLDGLMVIDLGAREFSNVHVELTGNQAPGGTVTIASTGTAGLFTLLVFSTQPGEQPIGHYGTLLVGAPFTVLPYVPLPSSVDALVPVDAPIGATIVLQQAALGPIPGSGNLSNAVNRTSRAAPVTPHTPGPGSRRSDT
jgi:hypothetical protein